MKLIIDIDDKEYEFIKDLRYLIIGGRGGCKTIQYNVINAIKNGKPVYEHERLNVEPLIEHCIGGDFKGCHNQCTWFICPICHCKVEKEDNFCKHCGADMRGDEE